MKNRRLLFDRDGSTPEINVSPLIDIVFILLIFFIVTTVFVEETGVDIQRPRAVSGEDLEKQSILIALTENGQVVYGGRDIGVRGVRPVVRRLLRGDTDRPVIIQADRRASIDTYTQVHDEALLAGAQAVHLSTRRGDP